MPETPVTILTTCKPFIGAAAVYQRNAIGSWRAAGLDVVILGNDTGAKEAAAELGCTHHGCVETDASGLPLVGSLFETGRRLIATGALAYLNSDILLAGEAAQNLTALAKKLAGKSTLVSARRRNIPLDDLLDFAADWKARLDMLDQCYGSWDAPYALDFFLVSQDWLRDVAPLVVGRKGWDNWMIQHASEKGIPIVDASQYLRLLHPLHSYQVVSKGGVLPVHDTRSEHNMRLIGSSHGRLDQHATVWVTPQGDLDTIAPEADFSPDLLKQFEADLRLLERHQTDPEDELLGRIYAIVARAERYYRQAAKRPFQKGELSQFLSELIPSTLPVSAKLDQLEDWLLAPTTAALKALDRPIIIWGCGAMGVRVARYLARNTIELGGYADSDPAKTTVKIAGKQSKIHTPGQWIESLDRPFFILASMYYQEMATTLKAFGFEPDQGYIA